MNRFLKLFFCARKNSSLQEAFLKDCPENELQLLEKIKNLIDKPIKEIMTPRADIEWLDHRKSKASLKKSLLSAHHSHVILCDQNLDAPLGQINVKNTLSSLIQDKDFNIEKHLKPLLFISPSLRSIDLILKMKKEKNFIALVVDEFGGTDGLITPQNLIRDLIGEIDVRPEKALIPLVEKDNTIILDARYTVDEFEHHYGPLLTPQEQESDIDTIGGLVSNCAGRVPKKGELIDHASGLRFEVLACTPRKVIKLKIHNIQQLKKNHEENY